MYRTLLTLAAIACLGGIARVDAAHPVRPKPGHPVASHADVWAARHAQTMSWHGPYAYTAFGVPVSLVVPPTAHMQTNMGWGVSQDTVTPIYHQFRRSYPGDFDPGVGNYGFAPTPLWPSHTSQFGVYYVRGPY
jgi:hypothetical protein